MRAAILIGLLMLAWSPSATAIDCLGWRRLDLEGMNDEIGGMISGHLNSNTTKKYTSENKAAIQRCLRDFVPRIVDDFFDRYLLSCI